MLGGWSELWGTRESEHPLHPSLGSLGAGQEEQWGMLSLHWAERGGGAMQDLWGQVWGVPNTHGTP